MYFYKGEIINLDTNLNLLYKAKTIDTVRHPSIKSGILETKTKDGKNNRQLTQLTPPKFVNKFMVTCGEHLYIVSALKADNESNSAHSSNNTIDVYNIHTGNYRYSFYIPKYLGRKLDQFRIKGHVFAAIYGPYLITYEFNENAH